MAKQMVRLNVEVSQELDATLNTIALILGTTKSDVLRKSIALIQVAFHAKCDGKKVGIAADGQILETEIVGL